MGGHRHGSHTMAGVGHNHSFPHMSNLPYPNPGISSTLQLYCTSDDGGGENDEVMCGWLMRAVT